MNVKSKEKMIWFIDNHLMAIIGALYTITALVVVASAWIENIFRYDLRLTISIYVALRPWTAVLYGIAAIIMTAIGIRYINKCVLHKGKRYVYYTVFTCILGCALCPCNSEWSMIMYFLHNAFAIILMFMVLISLPRRSTSEKDSSTGSDCRTFILPAIISDTEPAPINPRTPIAMNNRAKIIANTDAPSRRDLLKLRLFCCFSMSCPKTCFCTFGND